ncbi:MAG: hypothetical protein G01um101413_524 [Parcubacteria group bacterium Gr01-1014_13]|nr:MAG: hypothetical protein G01um101413_524 [Parcubacteria group bacterium Gr01-1014_13]
MSQAPKPPNPFDPVEETKKPRSQPDQSEETQISNMVNEGGHEPSDSETVVQRALETFKRLNEGGPAPNLVIETDGNHSSARWETPKK